MNEPYDGICKSIDALLSGLQNAAPVKGGRDDYDALGVAMYNDGRYAYSGTIGYLISQLIAIKNAMDREKKNG